MRTEPPQHLPVLTRRLPLAAALVPLSLLALTGWLNWKSAWQDAHQDMQRAAAAIAEYGEHTLKATQRRQAA